ncbi:DUF3050 domain-containing protein [Streptomyces sp. NPDC046939]|uniref:DUF3050 domain-containing protein n=1 Tax=Streptomyces sp. NPDC046939 TaxID=3155376 RepID=UPI0033D45D05
MMSDRYHWNRTHPGLTGLHLAVEPDRLLIVNHRMYDGLDRLDRIRVFLQHHVFAVWDFMSLLKSLQRELTCVGVPWVPQGPTTSRRLINDIVLTEESDELGDGYLSHFELYLRAMAEAGADTAPIHSFVDRLRAGTPVPEALKLAEAPQAAVDFVAGTWDIIESAPVHAQAAAFAFGREDLIPEMFERVLRIEDAQPQLATFKDYLVRHIDLDGEQHTPMAMQMLIDLCADDHDKWAECAVTVRRALVARHTLWSAVADQLMRA